MLLSMRLYNPFPLSLGIPQLDVESDNTEEMLKMLQVSPLPRMRRSVVVAEALCLIGIFAPTHAHINTRLAANQAAALGKF